MPVEFLSDAQAAAYGRFVVGGSRGELERVCFLDDEDKKLIARRRGDRNRLGFALQLVTVRQVGAFLADPLDVPPGVLDQLGEALGIADVSCAKAYAERRTTAFEHQEEIKAAHGLKDFSMVEEELRAWVDARAWNTGHGPKTIFDDAIRWLRKNTVLLPGVSTLARLVAGVREEATQRLWDTLLGLLSPAQQVSLTSLVEVADGARYSDLERWRKGPSVPSGRNLEKALRRSAEIIYLGLGELDLDRLPPRRVVDLARYGMSATATALRRHGPSRKLATLLATVVYLEARSIDDALELFDLLMVTELVGKAERDTDRERARRHPRLAKHSGRLAAAVEVLFEVTGYGEEINLDQLWESIEAVVSRRELRMSLEAVSEMVPAPGWDADAETRARLAERIATVSGFLKILTEVIDFGANAEAGPVLAAMKTLPRLLDGRHKLTGADVDENLLSGSWRSLVFAKNAATGAITLDKNAYVFCVLTQFHRHLKRRDIYAAASARWRDPRACLLAGPAWEAAKGPVLTDLGLTEDPEGLLGEASLSLDLALREVAERVGKSAEVSVDADGRLHVARLKAVPEPPSLIDLRARTSAMMPEVDLPEILLEVMEWVPGFLAAFTSASGGKTRLAGFNISVAACLSAQALNIGYAPVINKGVEALGRARLGHVAHTYLGAETYVPANAPLIVAQARIGFAQALGGGLVAAIDGMRFIVPVPSVYARPNRKFFGPHRGTTWLNMINDQAAGLGAMVVSGTPPDSLNMLDVLFNQDGGQRPDVVVSDTGSYSDVVFGLVHLLGMAYRPALADLPDQKGWRIATGADYGALNTFARGRIDLDKIRAHWPDILRVLASIYTGAIRAYDVVKMLQRDGHPTPLGEAIASYGRIHKTLHILTYSLEESYRRDIKSIRNLQEGRHSLAAKIFHGKKGQLYQRYHKGMEDQLGALGLVLNAVVLWNTFYMNAALEALRAQGYPVLDADVARLSPFLHHHINVLGKYSFALPDLGPGGVRQLRNPDEVDDDEEDTLAARYLS